MLIVYCKAASIVFQSSALLILFGYLGAPFAMNQSGVIQNLQQVSLSGIGESRCVKSELTHFEKTEVHSPISIKMVTEGVEHYELNGSHYQLKKGHFLLVNEGEAIATNVHTSQPTKGICIYPPLQLIQQAFTYFSTSGNDPEKIVAATSQTHFTSGTFRLQADNGLSQFLHRSACQLTTDYTKDEEWWMQFYLQLSTQMATEQKAIENKLKQLQSAKRQTREELYRRVIKARDFIHDNQFNTLDINAITEISALSKYHFLRSFKAVFNQSPYQYALQLKLSAAQQLIQGGYSYQQAAFQVGYSDGQNLRKALRRFSE